MGCDFYLNPPKDPCTKCKAFVEDRYTRKKLCLHCHLKDLKRQITKLKKDRCDYDCTICRPEGY